MRRLATRLLAISAGVFCSTAVNAMPTVAPGWDLLHTVPVTTFAGATFEGVSLGSFDFGGSIGVRRVGNADTIVHRLAAAMVPGPAPPPATAAPIPIELLALQLKSTIPINLGAGVDFYYITLQSARAGGGVASNGQMTITFDRDPSPVDPSPVGTFSSFFDVFFDIRKGCLSCGIVFSSDLILTSNNSAWESVPSPGAVEISGVNRYLSGTSGDRSQDFWPIFISEEHPSGARHTVIGAVVPEPGTYALLIGGFGLVGAFLRRGKLKAAVAA